MTPEQQERFVHQLFMDIELWLDTPRAEGGPYKGEVSQLRSFLEGLRRFPLRFKEIDGASWMLIQGDHPFEYGGIELPEDLDGLTHRTAERKFIFLYFFLVKKKGYELCLKNEQIWGEVNGVPIVIKNTPSSLYIKVR